MFKKILVPLDFTSKNRSVVELAGQLAKKNRGRVELLHVVEKVDLIDDPELREFYDRLIRLARGRMDQIKKAFAKRRVPIQSTVLIGNRAKEIVRQAAKKKCDVIVLNSHRIQSHTHSSDWGSISYKVAILARCPVLLVK